MEEQEFAASVRSAGGRAFLVGGYVRDMLKSRFAASVDANGTGKDRDYMVSGLDEKNFAQLFPKAKRVGKSFPVYLLNIDGQKCEVALARREYKSGRGYRGFNVEADPTVTIEEDLFRRDLTMNSMALELPERTLIDPFGGATDVEGKIIRATSAHFVEDPVRALRAARQAAEHGFAITGDTLEQMRGCAGELVGEPKERIVHELSLALLSSKPSIFFRSLQAAGLLEIIFPEIFRLRGKTQPELYHPEGDAFEHTMQVVDKVSDLTANVAARFAALAHDLGKAATPESMLPHHYGHEQRGLSVLAEWNRRMTIPATWRRAANLVIKEHMRAPRLKKPGKIVELLLTVSHSVLSIDDFNACILADHGSLPPYLSEHKKILAAITQISGRDAPPDLVGSAVGEWLKGRQLAACQSIIKKMKG